MMTEDKETLREAVARALCELRIRTIRRHDTPPDELEAMLPAAVNHVWREHLPQADAAIAAMFERLRTDLGMAVDLIREAKGYEGPSGGPDEPTIAARLGIIEGVKMAVKALQDDAKQCDCSAWEESECACGAWCEWKTIPSHRAVEIVRALIEEQKL